MLVSRWFRFSTMVVISGCFSISAATKAFRPGNSRLVATSVTMICPVLGLVRTTTCRRKPRWVYSL